MLLYMQYNYKELTQYVYIYLYLFTHTHTHFTASGTILVTIAPNQSGSHLHPAVLNELYWEVVYK